VTRGFLHRAIVLAAAVAAAAAMPASGASGTATSAGTELRVDLNKGVWVKGPNLPSPRQDAAATTMDGRIYLVGGFGPHDQQMATLLVLEPTFPSEEARPTSGGPIISHPGEWRYATTMPEPVDHAAAAGLNGYLYVAGGRVENLVTNKFWRYDPVDDTWVEMPSLPFPRYSPTMQAVDGKLYVIGGQSSHGNDETGLMIFDPETNTWKTEQYALGTERFLARSVVIDGRIYVVGGRNRDQMNIRTCDIYDPSRDRWWTCSSLREGRSDFGLATVNNRLMAIGGEN
jgi:N-acetylneuraminic acid mutarotase